MRSDALFFFVVILFFFVLWYASGGPTKPISFAGPYISPITDVDTVQEGYGDGSTYSPSGSGSVWADIMSIQDRVSFLQRQSSEIKSFGEASPKQGLVSVSGYGGVGAEDEDDEYISIRASGSEPVTITGWKVVSGASRDEERIPSGALIPTSGRVNDRAPIVLQPGDEAIIVSGESPIGVSFRENMCTGYLGGPQRFTPPLQNNCPSASTEFDRFYSGNELRDDACYTLMQRTPVCETPKENSSLSNACFALIDNHLTYNGCVETHRYDVNFSGRTWHIYLDRDEELWKSSRDAIKLIDENGLTVDLVTY